MAINVLGGTLETCSLDPLTGFLRDGCCNTLGSDMGLHLVCAVVTADFLDYSWDQGNDLITPQPDIRFPGLRPGDRWCLCVERWIEAYEAGCAPPVVLASTHISALEWVDYKLLCSLAVDPPPESVDR